MAVTIADIETAISGIQSNGQSFTLGAMTYNKANLSALIELRDRLLREDGRTGGTRPVFRGFNLRNAGY